MVDEDPNPLATSLLACQELDVRLGRRESLLDVCLERFDLVHSSLRSYRCCFRLCSEKRWTFRPTFRRRPGKGGERLKLSDECSRFVLLTARPLGAPGRGPARALPAARDSPPRLRSAAPARGRDRSAAAAAP